MSVVQVSHLAKKYDQVVALADVSFTLEPGEILGLLGPNGAGKTTIIHVLLGLLTPDPGEVSILGLSPQKNRKELAARTNFSSAYVNLPSNLKVMENLKIFADLYSVAHPKDKIAHLLEQFDMTQFSNRLTGALSSGEKTRLNLCKSLLNDPEILLLDEPTASLDPEMADRVLEILRDLHAKRKMGILYTSHDMDEVERLCRRVLFVHGGRVLAEGAPSDLKREYGATSLDDFFIKIVRQKGGAL